MANTRDIKSRIKSVKSTKKITGAMELVAASKMKRAIDSALKSRPYTKTLRDLAPIISASVLAEDSQETTKVATSDKALIVVIASNRGLCGSYNTQINRELGKYLKAHPDHENYGFISIGKKADLMLQRMNAKILASFPGLPEVVTLKSLQAVIQLIEKEYTTEGFTRVEIVYTEFKSVLLQVPHVVQFLPLQLPEKTEAKGSESAYTLEPTSKRVLEILTHRYTTSLFYQYMQESRASEESSRMIAMQNAKDSAEEVVEGLSLEYNKARQASITREISEISAGQLSSQTS